MRALLGVLSLSPFEFQKRRIQRPDCHPFLPPSLLPLTPLASSPGGTSLSLSLSSLVSTRKQAGPALRSSLPSFPSVCIEFDTSSPFCTDSLPPTFDHGQPQVVRSRQAHGPHFRYLFVLAFWL